MKKYLFLLIGLCFLASPVWAIDPGGRGNMGQGSGTSAFCDGTLACFQAEGSDTFDAHGGVNDCAALGDGDYCDQYAAAAKNGSYGIAHRSLDTVYSEQNLSSSTDSFCAEWWVKFVDNVTSCSMTSFRQAATHVVSPYLSSGADVTIYVENGDTINNAFNDLVVDTWYCIKFCYKEETGGGGDGKLRLWVTLDGDFTGAADYSSDAINTGTVDCDRVRWRAGSSGKTFYKDDGRVYSWTP